MSSRLDGCWAKIDRANENIKNLEAEITAFIQPDPYIVSGNVNHETKECIFVANAKPFPSDFRFWPERLSIICDQVWIT